MKVFKPVSSLIWALPLIGMATFASAYSGESYVTCQLDPEGDNFVTLRACPKSSCAEVEKLGPDTFLLTMEPEFENGWREVVVTTGLQDESYEGNMGWVYGAYICEIRYPNKR